MKFSTKDTVSCFEKIFATNIFNSARINFGIREV